MPVRPHPRSSSATALYFALLVFFPTLPSRAAAPTPANPPERNVEDRSKEASRKRRLLRLTVVGEMTEPGKKFPSASAQTPTYYTTVSGKYRPVGNTFHETPIEPEAVESGLQHSLSTNGFLPADNAHPPTVGLVYFWGPHALIDTHVVTTAEQVVRNILDRAAIVGGEKFATELEQAFRDSASANQASALPMGGLGAAAAVAQASAAMDPVKLFAQRSSRNDFLVSQASANCYYVVVSAYDFKSVATPKKQLLWRTRMSVNSQGISQQQSFPTLIATAAPFFGRETSGAEIISTPAIETPAESRAAETARPSAADTLDKK